MAIVNTAPIDVIAKYKLQPYKGAPTRSKRRTIITTEGMEGTGKTHFYHTMPDPILVIDIDKSMEGVTEKFPEKEIHRIPIDIPHQEKGYLTDAATAEAVVQWNKVIAVARDVYNSNHFRSLVVDGGGDAFALVKMARLGKSIEIPAQYWETVYLEFRSELITPAYDSGVNFLMTHKRGVPFKGDGVSLELKGYKDIKFTSQIHLVHTKDRDGTKKVTIGKCRVDSSLEGSVLQQSTVAGMSVGMEFSDLVALVYPESTYEEWF